MKFEEALAQLRLGKKITHPYCEKDVYFQGCYVTLRFIDEPIEDAKNRGMSIVKMKGETQHPDMCPPLDECMDPCKHGSNPQIDLLLLMSDDWEVLQ